MQQQLYGGYQPTQAEIEEQENQILNALGTAALATGGAAAGGFLIDTERRRRDAKARGEDLGFKAAAAESVGDLNEAFKVITGNTTFDKNRRILERGEDRDVSPSLGNNTTRLRSFLESGEYQAPAGTDLSLKTNPGVRNKNSLTQAAVAARDAFIPSAEDLLSGRRAANEALGRSAEGPRTDTAFSRMPLVDLVREYLPQRLGGFSPEVQEFRKKESKLQTLNANAPQRLGSVLGRAGSDLGINNGVRSFWWLVNAPQAVSDLVSEGSAAGANRHGLYGQDFLLYDEAKNRGWISGDDPFEVEPEQGVREIYRRSIDNAPRIESSYSQLIDKSPLEARSTEEIRNLSPEKRNPYRLFAKRRVNNNLSTLLALPAAIGINAGIGLVNPLGGSDGRIAAVPSQDDRTKTDNAVLEVINKYILGRQGDILPWDEFKKVRPDVSKDEYMRYKGYKWSKKDDYNPFDGDFNILGGIVKGEMDDETAIFGPEIQFLGKSLPFATTLMPTAAAALGAAAGTSVGRYGKFNVDGIKELELDIDAETRAIEKQLDKENLSPTQSKRIERKLDGLRQRRERLQGRKQMLNSNAMAPVFGNRGFMRYRNPVTTGLIGGAGALVATSLVGNELERRRRDGKLAENANNQIYGSQM